MLIHVTACSQLPVFLMHVLIILLIANWKPRAFVPKPNSHLNIDYNIPRDLYWLSNHNCIIFGLIKSKAILGRVESLVPNKAVTGVDVNKFRRTGTNPQVQWSNSVKKKKTGLNVGHLIEKLPSKEKTRVGQSGIGKKIGKLKKWLLKSCWGNMIHCRLRELTTQTPCFSSLNHSMQQWLAA